MKLQKFIKIGEREFKFNDQKDFSKLSGDCNPVHIDLVEARKILGGQCIVHGINTLLWSLECLLNFYGKLPFKFAIKFQKAINIEKKIICFWNKSEKIVKIETLEKDLLFTLSYEKIEKENIKKNNFKINIKNKINKPLNNNLENFTEEQYFSMKYGGKSLLAKKLFPKLSQKIGENCVYEISLLSNIIGMQLPGLYSLFLDVSIDLSYSNSLNKPFFKVNKIDKRFRLVDLDYLGINLSSRLKALQRPFYKTRLCSEIVKKIPRSLKLNRKKILIIGGSRGIGASLAQVSTILGAHTTITYKAGKNDAIKLCRDIFDFTNRKVKNFKLDITDLNQIKKIKFNYDVIFYFASPKIIGTQHKFDFNLFEIFYNIYCKSFQTLAKSYSSSGGSVIYWPSTIFLSQNLNNFQEYTLAKSIGEKFCRSFEKETKTKIIIDRLDRVKTDQTIGLLNQKILDPTDVAINIINLVFGNKKKIRK